MKEIPILFSTPMVQAIMEGRKSQTRRILKDKHVLYSLDVNKVIPEYFKDGDGGWCPYGKPGDILWVRETWGVGSRPDPFEGSIDGIEFKADLKFIDDVEPLPLHQFEDFDYGNYDKSGWRPSIHMPKTIARIWLQVTDIKVERLKDISQEDAQAEGIFPPAPHRCPGWKNELHEFKDCFICAFKVFWNKNNGLSGNTWDANPWVWVISFKVLSTSGKPDLITEKVNNE